MNIDNRNERGNVKLLSWRYRWDTQVKTEQNRSSRREIQAPEAVHQLPIVVCWLSKQSLWCGVVWIYVRKYFHLHETIPIYCWLVKVRLIHLLIGDEFQGVEPQVCFIPIKSATKRCKRGLFGFLATQLSFRQLRNFGNSSNIVWNACI